MKSKTVSFLIVLFALFSLQALADNTTITRSDDIGVVRGTISSNNIVSIPQIYESSRTNMARVYGFKAKYPLQIVLGYSTNRPCRDFYKDESYTVKEYIAFLKKYVGARVELYGVQRHYSVAGSVGCTFKEFKVLTNGEEMTSAQKGQKQTQPDESNGQANGNYAIGDMAVSVSILSHGFVRFRLLGKDGMPVNKPNHECVGKAEIKPRLDRDTLLAIRSEIKEMGNRATLKNAQMVDGKCKVESVVPISQ